MEQARDGVGKSAWRNNRANPNRKEEAANGKAESGMRQMYDSPVFVERKEQESTGILPHRKVSGPGQGDNRQIEVA